MKNLFLLRSLRLATMLAVTIALLVTACKEDEPEPEPPTAPELTTAGPTNITATSATVGGNITATGGVDVTEAGIVMSVLKPMPTTADEKKTTTTLTGAYTINLTELSSGTTYYVRAYAINEVGTSYGESVILTTGNLAPEAKTVTVSGTPSVEQKLTGAYAYSDPENNAESGSTFKWYRADSNTGTNEAAIDGATKIDYTLTTADADKFIRFGVTPKAAAGTGTGVEVKSAFTVAISAKPNAVPTVAITSVTGAGAVDEKLTVAYTYSDAENDAESGTTFKWYVADNASGLNEAEIAGETTTTLKLKTAQLTKFVRVGIVPKAGTGTLLGTEVRSSYTGPIGAELTTVTFTYNTSTVTYGIIKSALTQRKWLDRNLGAANVPTAYNDYANFGDLFQWGRPADGHQLVNRTSDGLNNTSVNGTTTTLSPSDKPADNKFIITSAVPNDWRATANNDLWQGVNGVNNPCPAGWRLPTIDEWIAEQLTSNSADNFAKLKITGTGTHLPNGDFSSVNAAHVYYWSSTTAVTAGGTPRARILRAFTPSTPSTTVTENRGAGDAVRCIKD